MNHRTLALTLAIPVGFAMAAPAQAQQTIVGKWSTAAGRCTKPLSIIQIGPKSLSGEDFGCDFSTVERRGDTVTWRGMCTYGADRPVPETVVARLQGQRLYYRFLSVKGENGPFTRCP